MENRVLKRLADYSNFEKYIKDNKDNLVFFCVGNSDVWYDSFGPIVGELLISKYNINAFVYGSLKNNVRQSNLNNYIDWINRRHINCKVIVLDAAVSNSLNKNWLVIRSGSTKCAYYSEESKSVGDYSVLCPIEDTGCVDDGFRNIIEKALTISKIISDILSKM